MVYIVRLRTRLVGVKRFRMLTVMWVPRSRLRDLGTLQKSVIAVIK